MKRLFPTALALAAVLALAGCGAQTEPEKAEPPKPEAVFEAYMDAMQQGDLDKAQTYLTDDAQKGLNLNLDALNTSEEVAMPFLKAWLGEMTVSDIQAEEEDDETATVTFDLTTPNIMEVITDVSEEIMSEEGMMALYTQLTEEGVPDDQIEQRVTEITIEKMAEAVQAPDVVMSTQSGDASLEKTEDGWKISRVWVDWNF